MRRWSLDITMGSQQRGNRMDGRRDGGKRGSGVNRVNESRQWGKGGGEGGEGSGEEKENEKEKRKVTGFTGREEKGTMRWPQE